MCLCLRARGGVGPGAEVTALTQAWKSGMQRGSGAGPPGGGWAPQEGVGLRPRCLSRLRLGQHGGALCGDEAAGL